MKSEELPKERTLAKCSCCGLPCYNDGTPMAYHEILHYSSNQHFYAPKSICNDCVFEADDQGITVEQLRERNNEHNVETEAY